LADHDAPAGGRLEPGNHPERRRLAAAGRPEQADELAVPDGDAEIGDGGEIAELLRDLVETYRSHGSSSFDTAEEPEAELPAHEEIKNDHGKRVEQRIGRKQRDDGRASLRVERIDGDR